MACLLPICFCELDYTLSISPGGTIPHTFLVFITIFHKGFRHRNAGSLKSGFAVSYFRTVETRSPDYSVKGNVLSYIIKLTFFLALSNAESENTF